MSESGGAEGGEARRDDVVVDRMKDELPRFHGDIGQGLTTALQQFAAAQAELARQGEEGEDKEEEDVEEEEEEIHQRKEGGRGRLEGVLKTDGAAHFFFFFVLSDSLLHF